jgi:hypothetical protein
MVLVERDGGFSMLYKRRVAMAALEVMAEAYGVPLGRLTMSTRQRANVAFARQTAMYLCHVVGRLTMREVALEFERERSTVSHACHAVEDRRESPVFDAQLTYLEQALRERIKRYVNEIIEGSTTGYADRYTPPRELKTAEAS